MCQHRRHRPSPWVEIHARARGQRVAGIARAEDSGAGAAVGAEIGAGAMGGETGGAGTARGGGGGEAGSAGWSHCVSGA